VKEDRQLAANDEMIKMFVMDGVKVFKNIWRDLKKRAIYYARKIRPY
jgi:hypothetical protein